MPALAFGNTSKLSNTDDARISRLEASLPRSVAGMDLYSESSVKVPSSAAVLTNGQISPSQGIATTGNAFPFVIQGAFGFQWNGSVLTIYWDGTNGSAPFVIRRADSSQLSIPRGSLQIGGVQANTKYAFAPFVSVAQPQRVSFVLGDTGNPRYAFSPNVGADYLAKASQSQRLTTNERLTDGFIYFTTGAAATSTNGGGAPAPSSPYTGNQYDYNNYEQQERTY